MTVAIKVKKDDRPFWRRRSLLGENISNGNWIIAAIFLLSGGGAFYKGWIVAGVCLEIASLLSFVWNESVAKTTTIIGSWIAAGAGSAWLLSLLCNYIFGMPAIGYALGLGVAIVGMMMTID